MADFLSRTGSRALTRLGMQQQARQQLIGEAQSLQPDYDAVTKAIMDRKLYAADFAPIANEVNGLVNNYMTKFQSDPFYAFSREGRRTVKMLRQMIHDPSIKMMEDNAKLADEQYKRAQEKDLGGDFVVRGGKVAAIKGGQRVFVDIEELGSLNQDAGEGILTVDTDHLLTRNQFGVRGGVPSYDMTSIKEIDQKIHNAFSGLGSTEVSRLLRDTSPGVDTNVRTRSNTNQLQSIVGNLLNKELTEADRNTLMSKYLQSTGSPSNAGFNAWLQDRIIKVAEGKASTVDERKDEQSISLKNQKAAAEIGKLGKEPLSPAHLIIDRAQYGKRRVFGVKGDGTTGMVEAFKLPDADTFSRSSGQTRDENGVTYTSRKLADLHVMSQATDLGNVLLRIPSGEGQGTFTHLPNIKDFAVVSNDDDGAPAIMWEPSYVDPQTGLRQIVPYEIVEKYQQLKRQGRPVPSNSPIRDYFTEVPFEEAVQLIQQADYRSDAERQVALDDAQAQASQKQQAGQAPTVSMIKFEPFIAAKLLVAEERGLFGIDQNSEALKPITEKITQAGYQGNESSTLRDYFRKYSGKGDILDNPGFFSYDDDIYEIETRIPVNSFQALNAAYGGNVTGEREDNNITSSGFYPKFDVVPNTLLDPTSIPNQVGRRQYQPLDAFKNAGTR